MANDFNVNEFKLKDPVRSIPDGLKEPVKDSTPGFFQSLRNPYHLWLEESLPASLYQWMTGNTKKKQAQEALNYIRNNPQQQGSKIYQEAERKLQRFGYLLDDGPMSIDMKEVGNMIKANPKMFGAELVNMLMADPWLMFMPLGWHRLGRGVVNSIRLKYAKQAELATVAAKKGFVNYHPAPLPEYPFGPEYEENSPERGVRDKVMKWGVTAHFMDEEYDPGPIIRKKMFNLEEPPAPIMAE